MPTQYYFDNRYHPTDNPNGFFAQPNMANFSNARALTRASSMFVQSGDYFRLQTIQLSYSFPQKLTNKIKLSALRVYVSSNNVFTITDYRGWNVESTSADVLTSGNSFSNYPIARNITAGINITL